MRYEVVNVPEVVKKTIYEHLSPEFLSGPDQLEPDMNIYSDLGADSLDGVELMILIDNELPGLEINDEEFSKHHTTVGGMIKLVEESL